MSLDVFQQVFSLSIASNFVNDLKGTQTSLQGLLQLILTQALPVIGAEWQLVWGPVVWKNKPDESTTGPDNSWYIAYHPGLTFEDGSVHPTYVIAVAGTPAESQYAWVEENFAVNTVSDFRAWVAGGVQNKPVVVPAKNIVPGDAYIATGIVNTAHLLLTTPAPSGAASAGTTLLDYVTNLNGSPRIVVTGHSLGGALSSSLAATLVSAGVTPANDTLTYPTAAPSPGNVGFTDLFVDTFPARKSGGAGSYKGWNLNLVNTLDIVPQAWAPLRSISAEQNLGNIPPIYGTPILPIVLGATVVFAIRSLSSGVLYKPLPAQYFTGTPPSEVPVDLEDYLKIAFSQHEQAYFREAGVFVPGLIKSRVLGVGLVEKTRVEIRFNHPVISDLEWAREHPEEAQREIQKAEASPEGKTFLNNEC